MSGSGTIKGDAAVARDPEPDLRGGFSPVQITLGEQMVHTGADAALGMAGKQLDNNMGYRTVGGICNFLQDPDLDWIRRGCPAFRNGGIHDLFLREIK